MKKFSILLLSILLVFVFVSCNNNPAAPTEAEKQEAAEAVGGYIDDISLDKVSTTIGAVKEDIVTRYAGSVITNENVRQVVANIMSDGVNPPEVSVENIKGFIDFVKTINGSIEEGAYSYEITGIELPEGFDDDDYTLIANGLSEAHYAEGSIPEGLTNEDDSQYPFDYLIDVKAKVTCNATETSSVLKSSKAYTGSFDVAFSVRFVNTKTFGDVYFEIENVVVSTSDPITIANTDKLALDGATLNLNWCIGGHPEDPKGDEVYIDDISNIDLSKLTFSVPASDNGTVTLNGVTIPFVDAVRQSDQADLVK